MDEAAAHRLPHDWYDGQLPPNVVIHPTAFLETSYALNMFRSCRTAGLVMCEASGAYDQTSFVVGPDGAVNVGAFTCLNSATLLCQREIRIGRHCLLAWGSVLMDTWPAGGENMSARRSAMLSSSADPCRHPPMCGRAMPIILEDNVWVGFDAVVMPGVTLGRGCVVGCKTVVRQDVEPYTVIAGEPPRVIRRLDPHDVPIQA